MNIAINILAMNAPKMDEGTLISEVTVFGLAKKVAEEMIEISKMFEDSVYRESDSQ